MVPIAHFSHALRVGDEIHLGATAGTDPSRRLAGALPGLADARAQADQMYRNMRLALELLGGRLENVVRLKRYVADWRDLSACDEAYGAHFNPPHPSRTTVASWGFPLPFAAIEAELTAVVGASSGCRYGVAPGEDGKRALYKLYAFLSDAGLKASDVVSLNVTLADVREYPPFEEAFTALFRPPYPVRSVSVAPLSDPVMRVELEFAAFSGGGEPLEGRHIARLPGAASAAMRVGAHLFISAQPGVDAGGRVVEGVAAQTRAAWRRIYSLLDEAGMEPGDVVRTNNWLTDWRGYGAFNESYGAFVQPPYSPRATMIGGMIEPHACVQIEALAHRDGRNATVLETRKQEGDT
jgi:enamine deaminase RidA (YjgF/YER057c/UK114 family)